MNRELSIVMPCLNEARSLPMCIAKAKEFLAAAQIDGEVIVADNGSTDGSPEIAKALDARVVHVQREGYGCALAGGIRAARGRYIVMADSDASYDLGNLMPFVEQLRDGADLVMGNRFAGGIAPGAMPLSHRYLGNPVLSFIGRTLFGSPCRDFYCGLRGFTKEAFERMELQSPGMEFALEMLVKATLLDMDVREVPTTLAPDQRGRPPHLRRWRDGWRSLRFYLMFSPRWVLWYPGLALALTGLLGLLILSIRPLRLAGVTIDYYALLFSSVAAIVGVQAAMIAASARYAAFRSGLLPVVGRLERFMHRVPFEGTVLAGALLGLPGLLGMAVAVHYRSRHGLQEIDPAYLLRIAVPALTLVILGVQSVFLGVIISIVRAFDEITGARARSQQLEDAPSHPVPRRRTADENSGGALYEIVTPLDCEHATS
jgi:glycosyltransferase involved in cell wall biosynthesis